MPAYMPRMGQLVRVTLRRDLWGGTQQEKVLVTPAGTVFEGIVVETSDAWFTIQADIHTICFFIQDESISITVIALALSA